MRTPRRRPSPTSCPSWTTTRSVAGRAPVSSDRSARSSLTTPICIPASASGSSSRADGSPAGAWPPTAATAWGGRAPSRGVSTYRVDSVGETRTERLLSLVLLGDLASLYLAVLRGVDPAVVDALD